MASIYDDPEIYDMEHSGPQPDVGFFRKLVGTHKPRRIVEYACGDGRITIPVAEAASGWGATVIGVDNSEPMLAAARKADAKNHVGWCLGDVTSWQPDPPSDFIFSGCASLSHLTKVEEQIAVWRNAWESLSAGGRFVVAEVMPDYPSLAEAMRSPSRATVCLDGDFHEDSERLLRCRAAWYRAHEQVMRVRYFYDRFSGERSERFVDDYEAHVFFPNELRLLFRLTGFEIEAEWGGYEGGRLAHASRAIVICGRKG